MNIVKTRVVALFGPSRIIVESVREAASVIRHNAESGVGTITEELSKDNGYSWSTVQAHRVLCGQIYTTEK
jgi:hypothetical protein